MGCLVLRPAHDYELIYYRHFEPGLHYLPVAADLSDLGTVATWVINNQTEAARIAYAGRARMIEIITAMPATMHSALEDAATYARI